MIEPSKPRSRCPIACTLDVLGDKWTLLVVRDLFRGVTRYSEFLRSPEGIATNILATRLAMLVDRGIAEQFSEPGRKRPAYRLTEMGKSLCPLLQSVTDWGLSNITGTEALPSTS